MKKKYQKYKMLIPNLVLTGCCLLTIATFFRGRVQMTGVNYDFILTPQPYGAFAAVVLNFIGFFVFRPYYKYILSFTLLFGLFNAINFIPLDIKFTFGIGILKLAFQPVILVVVLLTYIINFKRVNGFLIDQIVSLSD